MREKGDKRLEEGERTEGWREERKTMRGKEERGGLWRRKAR